MSLDSKASGKHIWKMLRGWLTGAILFAALILLVTHLGALENFVRLLRHADPVWLLIAVILQLGTYISVAAVWYLALRCSGGYQSLLSLIPLGIAKLFSDQAIPSGGISGTAFYIAALNRRGISPRLCMGTLLLSLVGHYGAYLIAALATLLLLYFLHQIHIWIVLVIAIFALVAVGIPAIVLWLQTLRARHLPRFLLRIPAVSPLVQTIAGSPRELLRSPRLLAITILLQGSVFLLDATTLWVMLRVVDMPTSFGVVFPSFMLASMVMTIGPIPLGLGSFEATCVGMLGVLGVPIEAALTATLLLRGFTLWLPMLPGIWLARRALR